MSNAYIKGQEMSILHFLKNQETREQREKISDSSSTPKQHLFQRKEIGAETLDRHTENPSQNKGLSLHDNEPYSLHS